MKPCIVVANPFDVHADAIVDQIRSSCTLIRVNPQVPLPPLTIDSAGNAAIDGIEFHVDDVTGIYCRSALEKTFNIQDPNAVQEFSAAEHYAAFMGLLQCIERRKWINYCFDEAAADGKVASLRAAARHGLSVPPFIVSSERDRLTCFTDKYGDVVIKPVSDASIALQNGEFVTIPEFRPFDAPYSIQYDSTESEDQVDGTPTLLQQKIVKHGDVRVVVIDDHVFATLVPYMERDPVDVRLITHRSKVPVDLPPALVASFVSLLRESLNLRFCAIDLIQRVDGQYFVVDINPQGNWISGNADIERTITTTIATSLLNN